MGSMCDVQQAVLCVLESGVSVTGGLGTGSFGRLLGMYVCMHVFVYRCDGSDSVLCS